jgi:hypothetical protein
VDNELNASAKPQTLPLFHPGVAPLASSNGASAPAAVAAFSMVTLSGWITAFCEAVANLRAGTTAGIDSW